MELKKGGGFFLDKKIVRNRIKVLRDEIFVLKEQFEQLQQKLRVLPLQVASRQGGIIELQKILKQNDFRKKSKGLNK